MEMVRCRANQNFGGGGRSFRHGEVVLLDPVSWAPWIEAKRLTVLESEPGDAALAAQNPDAPVMQGLPQPTLSVQQGEPEAPPTEGA